jgi:hypothetical protein
MTDRPSFDAIRDLLDYEILDVDEVPCGRVDDLELEWTEQGLVITALLVGPGAWQARLPALARLIARAWFGTSRVRVPIAELARVAEVIQLRSRATELGLGALDRRLGRWLAKVPGA